MRLSIMLEGLNVRIGVLVKRLPAPLITMFALIFSGVINAKPATYTFQEQVREADVIVIAKILSVHKRLVRSDVAEAVPIRVLFGHINTSTFRVEYGSPFFAPQEDFTQFVSNEEYLLFLRSHDTSHTILNNHAGVYHIRDEKVMHKGKIVGLATFLEHVAKVRVYRDTGQ